MTFDATVGGVNSNSFLTVDEADDYWESRAHPELWTDTEEDQESLLITATRMISTGLTARRRLMKATGTCPSYYMIGRTWTGSPSTTTQALPWPRIGMYDRNGNAIPSNIIPVDLKYATAELAGQLSESDRLIDNDVVTQGISSVKAGSVSVSFNKDGIALLTLFPDFVEMMLVPSWVTDEIIEYTDQIMFNVV